MERGTRPPPTHQHRFQLLASESHGTPKDATVPYTYTIAPIAVSTDITILGPPLSGNGWAALNGCCQAGGIHRGTGLPVNGQIHFAQRFAIDWMQLNVDAKFSHNDGKNVTDYADYGAKVIAVADGTVVETLANLDDQVPGDLPDPKTITIDNIDGNHIVLDLGHGKYAFYAHLQKNSLLVAKGAHVKRGQVLALLGNTGNTSAPHLHFHLEDSQSVLGSSGLPYVIGHFKVAGQLSREQFESSGLDKPWTKDLSAHPSSRDAEFPLDLTLINF
jgi:murein DD-endopeptidase MepM/ murein hydrolase activator NlpD